MFHRSGNSDKFDFGKQQHQQRQNSRPRGGEGGGERYWTDHVAVVHSCSFNINELGLDRAKTRTRTRRSELGLSYKRNVQGVDSNVSRRTFCKLFLPETKAPKITGDTSAVRPMRWKHCARAGGDHNGRMPMPCTLYYVVVATLAGISHNLIRVVYSL